MPIYRGSQKVTPIRNGVVPDRVYRGSNLVYESTPPVDPYTLGAVSWLPLNGDFSDHGTVPVTWKPGAGTVVWGDGYLKQLSASPVYNGGFAFDPTVGASVAAWVYVSSTGTVGARTQFFGASASFSELLLFATVMDTSTCRFEGGFRRGSNPSTRLTFPGSFSINTWYHLVTTMAPTTPGGTTWAVRGYANGTRAINYTQAMGTQHAITFNAGYVTAGNIAWVDDGSIYNRAITQEEVTALYSAGPN